MAQGKAAEHEYLAAVDIAYMINKLSGGPVIAPWQINDLSMDWIETFRKYSIDFVDIEAAMRKQKAVVDKIKRNHPSYGKRMN